MSELKSLAMKKALSKSGAKIVFEKDYGLVGQIIFKDGKKYFFYGNSLEINTLASSKISSDKGYSKYFLKKYGYSFSDGKTFFSKKLNDSLKNNKRGIDEGFYYAKKLGFPVILKPNNMSKGRLVVKVYNKKEYYLVAKKIFGKTDVMLIERFYEGNDFRIVVLDGKVISAYQRIPLFVIGDGKSSVKELILKKQRQFIKEGRDTIVNISDFRINNILKRKKIDFDSIINKNEKIFLLDNSNLSTGGGALEFTKNLHPKYASLAKNVAKDMNLRFCGIDLITKEDISKELSDYVILEVNDSPGVDNYALKEERKVDIFVKILKSLKKK